MKSKKMSQVDSVPTRVLMLLENSRYETDTRVKNEADTLSEAGYHVSVICPGNANDKSPKVIKNVRLFRYPRPRSGRGTVGYVWEYSYSLIATLFLSFYVWTVYGFDVIHAANPPDFFVFIALLYKPFGKRFVFDHHDLVPELYEARFTKRKLNRLIGRALWFSERLSCRFADRIIATNESHLGTLMQRCHVPPEKISIVRNGPDLRSFSRAKCTRRPGVKRITSLIYAGVIGYQDGVDVLLRALYHVVFTLNRKDFQCIIVGDGDALANVKSLAMQLKLENHLLFTGWVDQLVVASCLSSADIGVAPEPSNSLNDKSTVIKIMEYMAAELPVVAFDLPEHRITARGAAVYARPNDELDLARQIVSLMDDSQRRIEIGQIGRERIETELAWSHQQKYLLEVYKALGTGLGKANPASRSGLNLQ
jgi:glycosyltransferase involved in cell wall biosynthesis